VVARTVTDIAFHNHHAAGHAFLVARQAGAQEVTRVTLDDHGPVLQLAGAIGVDRALHQDPPALHLHAEITAGIAVDVDQALGHAPPHVVQLSGWAVEDQVAGFVPLDREDLARAHLAITGLQQQRADLDGAHAGQVVRGQG